MPNKKLSDLDEWTTALTDDDLFLLQPASELTKHYKLKKSNLPAGDNIEYITIVCSDEVSDLSAGTNKVRFLMPFGATITSVIASLNTAPTGSTLIVDINEAGTTILSTKLTIDATETSSLTAAVPPVISDAEIAENAIISIDIDQVGATVAGAGLKVTLICTR